MGRKGPPTEVRALLLPGSQSRPGWMRDAPIVLFPATDPSHCTEPTYTCRPAGLRRGWPHLCGDLAFGVSLKKADLVKSMRVGRTY